MKLLCCITLVLLCMSQELTVYTHPSGLVVSQRAADRRLHCLLFYAARFPWPEGGFIFLSMHSAKFLHAQ
jgi:hypothetical protein